MLSYIAISVVVLVVTAAIAATRSVFRNAKPEITDADLSAIYERAVLGEENITVVPESGPIPLASLWLEAEDGELVTTVFSLKNKIPVAPAATCEFFANARRDVLFLCEEVQQLRKQLAQTHTNGGGS